MKFQHLNIDVYGCECPLEDPRFLSEVMISSVERVGAKIVNSLSHQFVPHGLTMVLVLAESHLLITTWPEYKYANVDIFLCNSIMSTEKVWATLERSLCPVEAKINVINHTIPVPHIYRDAQ
jgi:S-adenosylmethionine decarboxylase